MAEYHIRCGLFGIYAGTLLKTGKGFLNKSEVTKEAINAVMQYMYLKVPKGKNSFAYAQKMLDGKYVRLSIEVADKCPDWAKEAFGERGE